MQEGADLGGGRDAGRVLVELDHEAIERLRRAVGQLQQEHCAEQAGTQALSEVSSMLQTSRKPTLLKDLLTWIGRQGSFTSTSGAQTNYPNLLY